MTTPSFIYGQLSGSAYSRGWGAGRARCPPRRGSCARASSGAPARPFRGTGRCGAACRAGTSSPRPAWWTSRPLHCRKCSRRRYFRSPSPQGSPRGSRRRTRDRRAWEKDVLLVLAEQRPLAAAVEEQVAAEDVVFCTSAALATMGRMPPLSLPPSSGSVSIFARYFMPSFACGSCGWRHWE